MSLGTSGSKRAGLRLLMALVIATGLAASATAAPADEPLLTHLPTIFRPQPGIRGRVTQNGAPVSGLYLILRRFSGGSWTSSASQYTDPQGYYQFSGVLDLGPGERYYVLYQNTSADTSRLWSWFTREITTYHDGDAVPIGDFDIANATHVAPDSGAYVPLPRTFQWNFRSTTPQDTFDFNLFDPDDGSPWFWTNPPLGHVNSYTLNNLPGGFSTNTWYGWFPGVYSPDGGYGVPYYFRWVAFSNAGQAAGAGIVRHGVTAFAESELGAAVLAWREAGD